MNFASILVSVIMSLQYPCHDIATNTTVNKLSCKDTETEQEKLERVNVIANAIDYASDKATCSGEFATSDCKRVSPFDKITTAALLIQTAKKETNFARNVHEGVCGKFECDSVITKDGEIFHKARTLWQMHKSDLIKDEWDIMVGTSQEATNAAAYAAIKILNSGYYSCGKTVQGMYSAYAGVKDCSWKYAKNREKSLNGIKNTIIRLTLAQNNS